VNGGAFALIGSPTPASFSDNLVNPGVAYFYRVRAVDAGGGKSAYSNIDLGTVFTDSVILVRSAVKAVHIIELRQVVDGLRAAAGLSVIIWTDPNLLPPAPAVKPFIKTIHLQQLRSNLDPALNALGFPLPVYSAISSPVKKIYLEELRNAVK
jgi:hypothetical protein